MKKINRKRLNNKGFTLIELLAVVVILAVVMGIAMTSVLSSMNNSRKGSLQNSAESTAQIFQNKYAEAMVTGETSSVFGAYNFNVSDTVIYPLIDSVATDLNLSSSSYSLKSGTKATALKISSTTGLYSATSSFIAFDGERIVSCLLANNGGSYYVGQAATTDATTITVLDQPISIKKGVMFACSDEQTSWTGTETE